MTIGVPVAVDPVALPAAAGEVVVVLLLLLPLLLQAATPAANAIAAHAVASRRDFITGSKEGLRFLPRRRQASSAARRERRSGPRRARQRGRCRRSCPG